MRRGLVLCMAVVLVLAAGTASAKIYTGLRFTGNGNYDLGYSKYWDSGFTTSREFAVGFGDEFQGEVALGFGKMNWVVDDYEEPSRNNDEESWGWHSFGLAGFYPIMEGSIYRIDAGGRFTYYSSSHIDTWEPTEQEWTQEFSGWSFGPLVRGSWQLGSSPIMIGPEVCLKYTKLTYLKESIAHGEVCDSEEYDISGFSVDYSFRADFYFE